jgi:hypothetical protein
MKYCRLLLATFFIALAGCTTGPYIPAPVPLSHIQGIPPKVLQLGIRAYNNAQCLGEVKNPYLTIVDFQKPSNQKRMWVINMAKKQVVFYTYVTHGKNSGGLYATHFSNVMNSLESSIGVMKTGFTYHGDVGYSMKLYGLEPGYNNNVASRYIVMHGATYATKAFAKENGYLGHTWGCFGVDPGLIKPIADKIHDGSILFAYYPNQQWLTHSKFLQPNACHKTTHWL